MMDLRTQLVRDEGKINHVYQDNLGYWTLGVGRLVDSRRGGGLSDDEVFYLLDNDIRRKTIEVSRALPWFVHMNEPRQGVLINMCFQLGISGLLGFPKMLAAARDSNYPDAAHEMLTSAWAAQTPERARRLAHQMEMGEWQ